MGLFKFEPGRPTRVRGDRIATPLGELVTRVRAGAFDSAATEPSQILRTAGGGSVTVWETADFRAELLRADIVPRIPPHMSVAFCQAAMWRLEVLAGCDQSMFDCAFAQIPTDAECEPVSGEALDAQTWRLGSYDLSIGTEDGEFLAGRAEHGKMMPRRFADLLHLGSGVYLPSGLRMPLPPTKCGDLCQLHFIVAGKTISEPDDISTWFAVDVWPSWILEQAGCA